jgi:hypothetical protein
MIFGFTLMSIFYVGLSWLINHVRISDKRVACWINPQFQRKGGQEYRLMRDWDSNAHYDVLVMGSSHAYRGYDPREFEKQNLQLFAAGSGFQNTLATYILSKDVFHPAKNSLVIIDLFDQTFVGDGVGCYSRVIENAGSDKAAFEFVWRKPDIRTLNAFSCRMFSKNAPVEVGDEPGYLMNGYCPKQDTMSVLPHDMLQEDEIKFNKQFRHYLHKLVMKLKQDEVKMVFVSHPQPKTAFNENYHTQFINFIQPVIQNGGIPYLDYNSNHSLLNTVHFADANHLNQAGVTLWNEQLLYDLEKLNLLSSP